MEKENNKFIYKQSHIYYEMEDTNKPLVVFIHGYNANMTSFNKIKNLDRNYDMLLIDSPGNGKSVSKDVLSIEFYAEAITAFLKSLNKEMFVVGHSLGGATALSLSKYDFVKGVMLMSPFNPFLTLSKDESLKILKPKDMTESLFSVKHLIYKENQKEYWNNIEHIAKTFLNFVQLKEKEFKPVLDQITSEDYKNNNLKNLYKNSDLNKITIVSGMNDFIVNINSLKKTSQVYLIPLKIISKLRPCTCLWKIRRSKCRNNEIN